MITISSEYIIGKTIRDFKIEDTSWIGDAVDWIGDAIEGIGYHCGFVRKVSGVLNVKNHRIQFPCDLVGLIGVYYNGYRIPLGSDSSKGMLQVNSGVRSSITDADFLDLQVLYSKLDTLQALEEPTTEQKEEIRDLCKQVEDITCKTKLSSINMNQCVLPYYNISGDFIQTSFQEGCIYCVYDAFDLDGKGFPKIIDSYKYRKAVEWYLVMSCLLQGYKHPVIDYKYAEDKWDDFRLKASNEQKRMSLDALQRFSSRWSSIKRDINYGAFDINSEYVAI